MTLRARSVSSGSLDCCSGSLIATAIVVVSSILSSALALIDWAEDRLDVMNPCFTDKDMSNRIIRA